MYYECHITCADHVEPRALKLEIESYAWKFSRIAGDPTLGIETFCYATKHLDAKLPLDRVIMRMNAVARALECSGFTVVRQKVELVMYDSREEVV
jgi:hypothetical protein